MVQNKIKKNNYSKKSPSVTIITTVLNGEKVLEKTIKSIISQNYSNIEYLVIDAASKDKTSDIIKKYNNYIDFWISEKDSGIYEGMNKGIKYSKGDIVYFLNSGDYLYDSQVIKDVVNFFKHNNIDIAYGYIYRLTPSNPYKSGKCGKEIDFKKLKNGQMICHQAMFAKRNIFLENGLFDTKYKWAADYDFLCKAYKKNYVIKYFDRIISNFDGVGKSVLNQKYLTKEKVEIIKNYFGKYLSINYLIKNRIKNSIKELFSVLGILKYFQKLRYKKFFRI